MESQPSNFPEHRAYREAGHAVMSFLIRKGFTDKYIPISREDILPPFRQVTIEGESTDWAEITSNLGSLLTVPQVLLAGYWAETIKYDIQKEDSSRKSKLINRARSILSGYVEEYYTDNLIKNRKQTAKLLSEVNSYVGENLRIHWASVETLATALLEQKTLSEEKAFEIIERTTPDDLKTKAKIELSRTRDEKLGELLKKIESQELKTKQTPQKRFWWEFWKK